MKKIKGLLFVLVVILCLALCGCELLHTHDYEWVNGEDYEKAYLRCEKCFMRFDPDKLYEEPIEIVGFIGSDPAISSIIYYEIDVEKGRFDYDEEFDISIKVLIDKKYFDQGDFSVMLPESPYYEIVGDKEQYINVTESDQNKFHNFIFRIKPTTPSDFPQEFDFKMKFNPTNYFLKVASEFLGPPIWYYDSSDEYFYGVRHLSFINDSHGMFLEESGYAYLFHNSINREYLAGVLDKDAYIEKVREYVFSKGTYTVSLDENSDEFEMGIVCRYFSANMSAKINFFKDGQYYKQIKDIKGNDENGDAKLANLLVDLLYEKGYITLEKYKKELEYISTMEPNGSILIAYPDMMPIAEYYNEHFYDYSFVEENIIIYESSDCSEENWASVFLSSDRIDVSAGVDVSVYTEFTDPIASFEVKIEEGLSLCSEIEIVESKIIFLLVHNEEYLTPQFRMKINLDGEETNSIDINIYGYVDGDYLYLSQWSANEAYNIFMDYANATAEEEITIEEIQQDLSDNNDGSSNVSTSYDITDTEISGTFYWKEFKTKNEEGQEKVFPLQYCVVSFYDRETIGKRYLGSCLTNDKGEYSFKFLNNTSSNENGGLDITIRVWAAGEDVCVTHGPKFLPILFVYYDDIKLNDNISSGVHTGVSNTYGMTDSNGDPYLFGQALQICQAGIFASKYYKEMKGADVLEVPIVYPHNIDGKNCFYSKSDLPYGRIYVVGDTKSLDDSSLRSFESWDSIMHEYGHFVADKEQIDNSPGQWHNGSAMAEHYFKHTTGSTSTGCNNKCANGDVSLSVEEVKEAGAALAWSEGWATYFSIASQEYYSDYLAGIYSVADKKYNEYVLVGKGRGTTEDTESTVYSILYDLYDSPPGPSDSYDDDYGNSFLSLGHKTLWTLVMNSKATSFDAFDDYFMEEYCNTEYIEKYAGLLAYHNLAPGDRYNDNDVLFPGIEVNGILNANCPTFSCSWSEVENELFFDNRTFVLNFYDEYKTLIGRTAEQAGRVFTIDSALWQSVLNSGESFYVSATIIENHEPKTDYEGQWYEFNISIPPVVINTNYTETLESGECFWYAFTVLQTGEYVFSTSGNTDTVGEILDKPVVGQSIDGLTDYNDNGGEDNNFSITKYLEVGQKVYIRISGVNWTATGEYTFTVKRVDHEHIYTHRYVSNGDANHKAYCACGEYVIKKHIWYAGITNNYCKDCGFITTGGLVVKPDFILDEDVLYYHREEESSI